MRYIILEKAAKITGSVNTGKLFYDREVVKGVQIESFVVLVSFVSVCSVLFISLTTGENLGFSELISFQFLGFLVGSILIFYGSLLVFFDIFYREFKKAGNHHEATNNANAALFWICTMPIAGSYLFTPTRNKFQKLLENKDLKASANNNEFN